VRHFTIDRDAGELVEIVCSQPGARDGCWMGYAIKFAGTWDGWVAQPNDHRTMHKVVFNVPREAAIAAVVDNWVD
jgi:hypothetical protein